MRFIDNLFCLIESYRLKIPHHRLIYLPPLNRISAMGWTNIAQELSSERQEVIVSIPVEPEINKMIHELANGRR